MSKTSMLADKKVKKNKKFLYIILLKYISSLSTSQDENNE